MFLHLLDLAPGEGVGAVLGHARNVEAFLKRVRVGERNQGLPDDVGEERSTRDANRTFQPLWVCGH